MQNFPNNNSYQAGGAAGGGAPQQQQQRTYENIDAAAYDTSATNSTGANQFKSNKISSAAYYPSPPNPMLSKPTQILQVWLAPKGVNVELLNSKLFYLFFYAAFGSLFPLMGIFFKQHGLSTAMTGLLIGIRPFIEFAATPVWARVADKIPHPRSLLLVSLALWMSFTVAISFIQPQPLKCFVRVNANTSELVDPSAIAEYGATDEALKYGQFLPRNHVYGLSPVPIHRYAENLLPWGLDGGEDEEDEEADEKDERKTAKQRAEDEEEEEEEREEEDEKAAEDEEEEEEAARVAAGRRKATHGGGKTNAVVKNVIKMVKQPMKGGKKPTPPSKAAAGKAKPAHQKHEISYVKPPLSSMVFSNTSVKHTFLLLFLITIVGEFFR